MPSKTSPFLIASLAVNAALLGVVGGRALNKTPEATPANMQFERYGPTSDVVKAAWDQLPEADRMALRKQLREQWAAMDGDRKLLSEAGKAVYASAKAEPFDETQLRNSLMVFQQREQMLQGRAEDVLISHLGKMPPDARATAAVGLLTPFSARMQRADGKGSPRGPSHDHDPHGPMDGRGPAGMAGDAPAPAPAGKPD
jgi:uncharacterized membrane protein